MRGGIPFAIKVDIRSDTIPHFEEIAIFAARMGATQLSFGHVMPTSTAVEDAPALSLEERRQAELEIATLSRIFKMKVTIDVGYYNIDKSAPCSALAGVSANIDYRGHLSLCCNLSGFRGAVGQRDVVADLHTEDLSAALKRLKHLAAGQLESRRKHLATISREGREPDLYSASPCLFCLEALGKLPWRQAPAKVGSVSLSLPVLAS